MEAKNDPQHEGKTQLERTNWTQFEHTQMKAQLEAKNDPQFENNNWNTTMTKGSSNDEGILKWANYHGRFLA